MNKDFAIVVKNLDKSFSKKKIIDCISFNVEKNKISGLLGLNGSGKSTIMKIIVGLTCFDHGDIFFSDLNIKKDQNQIKKKLGFLSENNPLYTDMYVLEYLDFISKIYGLEEKKIKEKCEEVMLSADLIEKKNEKIKNLSKGFRQRVGISQILLHDPEILILDEPTNGLDQASIFSIRNLILQISKNKSILISSHILEDIKYLCSEIMVLNNGKISFEGSLDKKENEKFNIVFITKEKNIDLFDIDTELESSYFIEKKENKMFFCAKNKIDCMIEVLNYFKKKNIEIEDIKFDCSSQNLEEILMSIK